LPRNTRIPACRDSRARQHSGAVRPDNRAPPIRAPGRLLWPWRLRLYVWRSLPYLLENGLCLVGQYSGRDEAEVSESCLGLLGCKPILPGGPTHNLHRIGIIRAKPLQREAGYLLGCHASCATFLAVVAISRRPSRA